MALESDTKKTEHNGAKNGGGAWCKRADAKHGSKRRRRAEDRRIKRTVLREGARD